MTETTTTETTRNAELRRKALTVEGSISNAFVGRSEVASGLMLAALSGEHVLLLGPPGTAKSAITRHFANHFEGAKCFDWLLTKFSVPEEIFGPLSLKLLKEGRYERIPDGKLPTADFAFLDEIFKANSSILNALLTAANERKWHDGAKVHDLPLRTIIGASNEMPAEESLLAFFDRFLLRFNVQNVATSAWAFEAILRTGSTFEPTETMTMEELDECRAAVESVDLEQIYKPMFEISKALEAKDIVVTDRRWKKAAKIVAANSWMGGFDSAEVEDLSWLASVLWSDPKDIPEVQKVVNERAAAEWGPQAELADSLLARYEEIKKSEQKDAKLGPFVRDAANVTKRLLEAAKSTKSARAKERINKKGREVQAALKVIKEMVFHTPDETFDF